MSTALVTDSTAYLPPDLLEGLAVHVVPLHVVVGGTEHAEGVDIDAELVPSGPDGATIRLAARMDGKTAATARLEVIAKGPRP